MKIKALNRINHGKIGDLVQCMNCGKVMLVDIGEEKCPECHAETLSWYDDKQEYRIDDENLILLVKG